MASILSLIAGLVVGALAGYWWRGRSIASAPASAAQNSAAQTSVPAQSTGSASGSTSAEKSAEESERVPALVGASAEGAVTVPSPEPALAAETIPATEALQDKPATAGDEPIAAEPALFSAKAEPSTKTEPVTKTETVAAKTESATSKAQPIVDAEPITAKAAPAADAKSQPVVDAEAIAAGTGTVAAKPDPEPTVAAEPEPVVVAQPEPVAAAEAEPIVVAQAEVVEDTVVVVAEAIDEETVVVVAKETIVVAVTESGDDGAVDVDTPVPVVEQIVAAPQDLTKIVGIGPKMAMALAASGITTFAQLAATPVEDIRKAVAAAGMRLAPSIASWPEQAKKFVS